MSAETLPASISVEQLALGYMRLLADGGVAQNPDTWVFLTDLQLEAIFGAHAYEAFKVWRPAVWPEMVRLAPLIEEWP